MQLAHAAGGQVSLQMSRLHAGGICGRCMCCFVSQAVTPPPCCFGGPTPLKPLSLSTSLASTYRTLFPPPLSLPLPLFSNCLLTLAFLSVYPSLFHLTLYISLLFQLLSLFKHFSISPLCLYLFLCPIPFLYLTSLPLPLSLSHPLSATASALLLFLYLTSVSLPLYQLCFFFFP